MGDDEMPSAVRDEFTVNLDEYEVELARRFELEAAPRRRLARSTMSAREKSDLINRLGTAAYKRLPWKLDAGSDR